MTYYTDISPDVLTDGFWVRGRDRALHWVAAPFTPGPAPTHTHQGKPVPTELVACPFCRAKVGQTCKSAGGNPVIPHAVRLAPRLCPCGSLVERKKQLCEPCRLANRRRTYKLREMRAPARTRRKKAA